MYSMQKKEHNNPCFFAEKKNHGGKSSKQTLRECNVTDKEDQTKSENCQNGSSEDFQPECNTKEQSNSVALYSEDSEDIKKRIEILKKRIRLTKKVASSQINDGIPKQFECIKCGCPNSIENEVAAALEEIEGNEDKMEEDKTDEKKSRRKWFAFWGESRKPCVCFPTDHYTGLKFISYRYIFRKISRTVTDRKDIH
ncbi:uncharacterized protein LOC105697738 [Orussus abietinus]|uniref:uncharacterized protein LOC105697738 n=1 Tax=Orussus abietinus TaxID=222816 RepID=UPI0006263703|nr:uncharacterized protein LOC105697738 [Orussus abietinus]